MIPVKVKFQVAVHILTKIKDPCFKSAVAMAPDIKQNHS